MHDAFTVARANAYHSLSLAFGSPMNWQGTEAGSLANHFAALGAELEEMGKETAKAWSPAFAPRDAVMLAYTRLFLGPFEILASPYASTYLDQEGKLMGEVSQYVVRSFAEVGLIPNNQPSEIPDHICQEMEFMYFLAFTQASADDPTMASRQRRFWHNHLGRWMVPFATKILEAEVHPFYTALANLVREFAAFEAVQLAKPLAEPSTSRG